MQLDVRHYLKKVRSMSLEELEREFNDAIEVARHYPEPKYGKSPILSWIAIAKNAERRYHEHEQPDIKDRDDSPLSGQN